MYENWGEPEQTTYNLYHEKINNTCAPLHHQHVECLLITKSAHTHAHQGRKHDLEHWGNDACKIEL